MVQLHYTNANSTTFLARKNFTYHRLPYAVKRYFWARIAFHTTHTLPAMGWLLYLTASPAALIMFLRILALVLPAQLAQLVSFAAFSLTAFILMMLCASYGVFASIALRMVGYGGLSQWTVARAFKWSMWLTTGVTFRVTGSMKRDSGMTGEDALNTRPVVFVGNHQTEMDVLMLGCMFPKYTSVTAKSSLKNVPFLGWFSESSNYN